MKESIKVKDIPKLLEDMEKGNKVLVELEDKDLIKKYELLNYHVESYNNLFRMYVQNKNDIGGEDNVKIFLEKYAEKYYEFKKLENDIILGTLGTSTYKGIIEKKVRISIDWEANSIMIIKM